VCTTVCAGTAAAQWSALGLAAHRPVDRRLMTGAAIAVAAAPVAAVAAVA
jgi:hypothetical protein